MRNDDRLVWRLRDILLYGERAKNAVRGRRLSDMEAGEIDGLCYLVLIVSEATSQVLALDSALADRHLEIPSHDIRSMGDRLHHGFASVDLQAVHEVVENGHLDQLLRFAKSELERRGN